MYLVSLQYMGVDSYFTVTIIRVLPQLVKNIVLLSIVKIRAVGEGCKELALPGLPSRNICRACDLGDTELDYWWPFIALPCPFMGPWRRH